VNGGFQAKCLYAMPTKKQETENSEVDEATVRMLEVETDDTN
jgi:hypothetical protein